MTRKEEIALAAAYFESGKVMGACLERRRIRRALKPGIDEMSVVSFKAFAEARKDLGTWIVAIRNFIEAATRAPRAKRAKTRGTK